MVVGPFIPGVYANTERVRLFSDLGVTVLIFSIGLEFNFRRPMRFLDMEGGPAIFAEPNDIASRYQQALSQYLAGLKQVVLESAIDYTQVNMEEDYEKVLIRFLMSRAQAKGVR